MNDCSENLVVHQDNFSKLKSFVIFITRLIRKRNYVDPKRVNSSVDTWRILHGGVRIGIYFRVVNTILYERAQRVKYFSRENKFISSSHRVKLLLNR